MEDESGGRFMPQFLTALGISLSWLAGGFAYGYSSPAVPSMKEDFDLSIAEEGFIGSLVTLGCMVGGLVGGPIAEAIGRRGAVLYAGGCIMTAGWLCISLGQVVPSILAGRFISGVAIGICTATVPTYLGECISPRYRGTLSSLTGLMMSTGICLGYVVGAFLDWIALAWVCLSLVPVFMVATFLLPESPVYLLGKGNEEEAIRSMRILRGASGPAITEEMKATETQLRDIKEQDFNFVQILRDPTFQRPFALGMMIMVFQQLSAIESITLFSVDIFASTGSAIDENVSSIIMASILAVATLIVTFLVDKAGRRPLLIVSHTGMGFSLVFLGTFFYLKDNGSSPAAWIPLATLILFMLFFSTGSGPIAYIVIGELFSPNVSAFASGVCTASNWLAAFVLTSAFKPLEEAIGAAWIFWFYAACNCLGAYLVYALLPETRGKSLPEIEAHFKRRDVVVNEAFIQRPRY